MLFCTQSTFTFVPPLKKAKNLYLNNFLFYIILFYLFTTPLQGVGQELYLHLKIEKSDSTQEKFGATLRFDDFSSLEQHILKTVDSIQKTGFLNTKITSLIKENDSIYIGTLTLGKKHSSFNFILRIHYLASMPINWVL